jgi:hypothetical protein
MPSLRTPLVLAALCVALLSPRALSAQEILVPWDAAGRLEVVEPRLAERLGLFVDDHPGFRGARLFELPDGSFVLEVTADDRGRTARHRLPLTAEEGRALRLRVQGLLAERAREAALDHDGRMTLLLSTTAAGIGYYGWAVPTALGLDAYHDLTAFNATYLLVAGGSFFLPWMVSAHHPISWGMQQGASYGMTRGIAHGWALNALLFGRPLPPSYEPAHPDDPPAMPYPGLAVDEERWFRYGTALSVAAGVSEGVAGYALARRAGLDGGQAATIGLGGDAGMLGGFFTALLLGADYRGGGALTLGGAAAGLAAGTLSARHRRHTMGDVSLLYTTGMMGLQAGVTAMILAESQDDAALGAALLVGGGAGLALGSQLVRSTNFTVAQASLVSLGALAGGFAGMGVAALAGGDDPSGQAMAALSLAGSIAGFVPMYRRYADEARHQPYMRGPAFGVRVAPTFLVEGDGTPRPGLSLRATF